MDFETVALIILISVAVGIFSFMAGANFCIEITRKEMYAKLVDAIEVNNTEGDTMTISATFQKQGDID